MSDQPIDTSVRIDPNEEITEAKKLILLTQWKEKVEAEIAGYTEVKDKIYSAYKEQKERYDKTLGVKMKKIKKFDSIITGRKKVLMDIIKEIELAKNPAQPNPSGSIQQ